MVQLYFGLRSMGMNREPLFGFLLAADVGVDPSHPSIGLSPSMLSQAAHAGYLLMVCTLIKAGAPLPEGGIRTFIQMVNDVGEGVPILPVSIFYLVKRTPVWL
jgi:hypothetical protein